MIITGFEISTLKIALKEPFITALRRVDEIEDIVIKVHTDTPLVGYGEACAVRAITGTSNEKVIHDLQEHIFPALLNKKLDKQNLFTVLHQTPSSPEAKACVDIALHDLLAKEASQSLYTYLGAKKSFLHTDLTISVDESSKMQTQALKAIEIGFTSLKIKLDENLDENIRRMRAINEVLSPDIKLRLDPNQALELEGCLELLRQIPTHNIECIEQPFIASDLTSMKALKEKALVPVLADESLFNLEDAKKLLHENAADSLNIKLMKSGGIHEAIKIAKYAKEYNTSCMIGSMLEGPISLLAAVHFALSQDNIVMADLDSPIYLQEHPLLKPFNFQKDCISLSKQHGLGIDEIIQALPIFPTQ